ncbi:CPBP family intramembrane glutamic endopeptidase [Stakelama marina]|uniref:CPBP family intramembrane metalloprotease n=1 Tax=Stakelama marina TaxID=2826939 RepID=A0A8T4INB1_9SPHN|nr:CPBP family intramembrane metalloprotease [Stakelama marina]MBR0553656.1 CPBP family intramembrane metalloprotease [Stakelama marina]
MARLVALGNAKVLKPGKLRWLRAIGWLIAMGVAVTLVFTIVTALGFGIAAGLLGQPFDPAALREPGGMAAAFGYSLGVVGALLIYALMVHLGEQRKPSELSPRWLVPDLLGGLAIGAGMMAIAVTIMSVAGWATVTPQPVRGIWGAVGLSVESGGLEELLFRLVLFRLLWRAAGVWPALALSALVFGLVHLTNENSSLFAALCIAVEAGVMLATFYILTGRAWMSIGVHAGWNFTQGWIFGAAVSGTGGFAGGPLSTQPVPGVPEWLSGGAFGPEASLAGLIVGCGFGAWLLWLAMKRGVLGGGGSDLG